MGKNIPGRRKNTCEISVVGKAFKELKEVHCDWSIMSKWNIIIAWQRLFSL